MAFFDGKGNSIEITAKLPSVLNGADVIFWGDSNVYYSAGNTLGDIGSLYQRLETEFSIKSWQNKGTPGKWSSQGCIDFTAWATDEMSALYNKESTIFLFGYGTNDTLEWWEGQVTAQSSAMDGISAIMAEKFPKAQYHWIIPPETDWSKWTGSTEPDKRNMAEKMPYIIQELESCQFPYCDMYHTSGIASEMLPDGVHLGGGGNDYTTDAVYKYYRRLREYLMNK
jgi:hypothetical protein